MILCWSDVPLLRQIFLPHHRFWFLLLLVSLKLSYPLFYLYLLCTGSAVGYSTSDNCHASATDDSVSSALLVSSLVQPVAGPSNLSPLSGLPRSSITTLPSSAIILKDTLCGRHDVGVRCSPFINDPSKLLHLAVLHGLSTAGMNDIVECHLSILNHLMSGNCFYSVVTPGSNTCTIISKDYASRNELPDALSNVVGKSKASVISTDHMLKIAHSLGVAPGFKPDRV